MFIDETAVNERTLDRKFGWSPIGTPARQVESIKRTKKWSALPLYTIDGFVTWQVIHGSYTVELFRDFLQTHVIPNMNEYPAPRSVLIMDNCKIHRDEVLDSLYNILIFRLYRMISERPILSLHTCHLTHLTLIQLNKPLRNLKHG